MNALLRLPKKEKSMKLKVSKESQGRLYTEFVNVETRNHILWQ